MNSSSSESFHFSCPSCLRPIKASPKAAGKTLPCPGCGKTITVPMPEEAQWDAVHEPPSENEYALAEPVESQPYTSPIVPGLGDQTYESDLDMDTYRDAENSYQPRGDSKDQDLEDEEKIIITERPKLPPHPMITGIFTIFADPSAIIWLLTLSFIIAIFIGSAVFPVTMFAGALPRNVVSYVGTLISCGFCGVIGLGVLLFTSNCFLSILQDSAAGNRTIESWPDKAGGALNLAGMLYVLGASLFGIAIGLGVSWSLPDANWLLIQLIVNFFTFPFFLVSSMEADSPMLPISTNMARSLSACFAAWFAFYLEAAILFAIAIGATTLIVHLVELNLKSLSIACAMILGPLFTFLLFIYFRLLGRLVWVCDEWFRSLEPEEDEEGEEEEEEEW